MKVAVFSTHQFDKPYLLNASRGKHELLFIEEELNDHTTELALSCKAVALFTSDHGDRRVLEKLADQGIKYIVLRSVGFDHIDLKIAKKLNLKVANVPAYSPYAVAEHAVALLMGLNRKLKLSQELIKRQDFRLDGLTGFDVHGKTVGIVGLGKIGQVFAKIMHGFGCKILYYDKNRNSKLERELGLLHVSLRKLCSQSDIVSIHCPLNSKTKHMFNKSAFALMKKHPVLLNTARGPIVNTEDLVNALRKGIIAGAGLDVYEFEKGLFFHDHRKQLIGDVYYNELISNPNVLITAHQAFLTDTALRNIAETTIANLSDFESDMECKNEVKTS